MIADPVATLCTVCHAPLAEPLYRHDGPVSISSTAATIAAPTIVYVCESCGHVQSAPLPDVSEYYDSRYNVHLESDESDDLYDVRAGVPVYRASHQAAVVLENVQFRQGAAVLDYGCGKAMTLRAMLEARPDLEASVFDVSDAYRAAWDRFIPRTRQAVGETPLAWNGRFDAVLSFFALEHTVDPYGFLDRIRRLLQPGGALHLAVPNVRRNPGDLIVVDHVNHFMPSSLRRLLANAGFTDVRIDDQVHESALIVEALRGEGEELPQPSADEVAAYVADARQLAQLWTHAGTSLREFEEGRKRDARAAVYGSGFYGIFLASRMKDPKSVAYFLDRSAHQQTRTVFDRPVLAPDAIGADIDTLYVGLNPARAREIVAGVPALHARPRDYFFL